MAKVAEVKDLQKKCMNGIAHQRYRFRMISDKVKRAEKSSKLGDHDLALKLSAQMSEKKTQFHEMEEYLPHKNGYVWFTFPGRYILPPPCSG